MKRPSESPWFRTSTRLMPSVAPFLVALLLVLLFSGTVEAQGEEFPTFKRGDVNASGAADLPDVFVLFDYLFAGLGPIVACDDSYDVNDDGRLDIADPIALLVYLFLAGDPPASPFSSCGLDPTDDDLDCIGYPGCDPITEEELTAAQVAHVLRRITYGQTVALFDEVNGTGVEDYIEEQLDPDSIDETMNLEMISLLAAIDPESSVSDLYRLQFIRAQHSERQLVEVLADFWDVHFSTQLAVLGNYFLRQQVGGIGVYDDASASGAATYFEWLENENFRSQSLGSFEDLLVSSATSVTMLVYLDNISNSASAPNENYAREILELHAMGVDNGYTQADIEELARVFTGWTICLVEEADAEDPAAECQELVLDPAAEGLVWAFHFDDDDHDDGEKTIFAGTLYEITLGDDESGIDEGLVFIEHLTELAQTAEFVCTKLIRRFVSDDVPEALLADCVAAWGDSGGDILEVMDTILYSEEFLGTEYRMNKVKTPFEYIMSTLRAFDGESSSTYTEVLTALTLLIQTPFNFPTPDGFPERAIDQVGTYKFLARFNFNRYIYDDTDGIDFDSVVDVMFAASVPLEDADAVVDFWLDRLFAGFVDPVDRDLAADFLTTDDDGMTDPLDAMAPDYGDRIRKLLTYIANFPQHMKQ